MILAVVALAEHLRLTTLADGVDTAGERKLFVAQIGFNAVQGRARWRRCLMRGVRTPSWSNMTNRCRRPSIPAAGSDRRICVVALIGAMRGPQITVAIFAEGAVRFLG